MSGWREVFVVGDALVPFSVLILGAEDVLCPSSSFVDLGRSNSVSNHASHLQSV